MKKKLFRTLGLIFLCIAGVLGFVGCKTYNEKDGGSGNTNPAPEPQNTVTVSFLSRYGTLSFGSKTYELENGHVYIDSEDFPTITGEGDSRIFDKWLYENNIEFSADNPVTKDMTLHASFVESEFVWTEKWELYDNEQSMYTEITFNVPGDSRSEYRNDIYPLIMYLQSADPTFTKIKKSDCLDSYITKSEYSQKLSFCFITSSNGETKFVTESDITTDTYNYYVDIIIGNENFGYYSYGYLPKGVNLYQNQLLSKQLSMLADPRKGSAINRLYKKFVQENSSSGQGYFESGIDLKSSKHYIVANNEDMGKYDLERIRQACNDDNYTCNYDFNDGIYIAYICVDYMYYYEYNTDTDTEYFSFVATDWTNTTSNDTVRKIGCTKEEFEEFRAKYLPHFEYKKAN